MKLFLWGILVMTVTACTSTQSTSNSSSNPLTKNWWEGPFDGVPPFNEVKVLHFKPALSLAMDKARKSVLEITQQKDLPTFENTLIPLEKMDLELSKVFSVYYTWGGSMSSPEYQAVEKEMAPVLTKFRDEITLNPKLFERIEGVYVTRTKKKLTREQKRLAWYYYNRGVLEGAKLQASDRQKLTELNQKLSTLTTQFGQNQLADEENYSLVLDNPKDLAGLPQSVIEGATLEAANKKLTGKWVFPNTRSAMEPFLTFSSRRELREKAFKMWTARGDNENSNNNNKLITEILKLRAERAKILGYRNYAAWKLADTMAKDPQKAMDLMMQVWKPAVAQAKKEVAEMQAIVKKEGGTFKIEPWDYRYYAEKVRLAKYDLDLNQLKPYLVLENIQKGMFLSAEKLFGLKFELLTGVPVFHPDMTVYQVTRNGQKIGLWYFDPYARPGKSSGAWMSSYRDQNRIGEKPITPLVSNNSNFIKGKAGEPVTISWDDADTMFHEFGHALHGLLSNVTYPSLSGTNVPRDYVEFPSQVYENFLTTPEVLAVLKNSKGETIPKELIQKLKKSSTFNEGFATVEFLSSAILDMKLHLSAEETIDPKTFEKTTLQQIGMPPEIVMRHRLPAFGHLFSDEGYAAGYYSYLWSQVLDHDAFEAFEETKNPYHPEVAKKLYEHVFSVGNTIDPEEGYRKFRGRDPKVKALLKARGFPVTQENPTSVR